MIKKIKMALFLLIGMSLFAQEAKKEAEAVKTKMDIFASKTGVITKFTDYNLESMKTLYVVSENRIRKINSGGITSTYFYQIEKNGKYGTSTASIEYSDLLEIIKALKTLKEENQKDASSNPDYLENKFVTADGFKLGYYVSKGKSTWILQLEKYGSDNTLYFDNVDIIENAFNSAKAKIEELKK